MPSPGEEHEALLGHGPQGINPDCAPHEPCFLSGGSRQDGNQKKVQTKLVIALVLCIIFMIVEVVGGYLAHSVAILADAAHMLSDAAGFGISLFAAWAVTRRSHKDYSFGYHRAETIGALLSTLTIWAVTGALVWEAIQRILDPQPVDGKLMFIVATAGIVFNLVVGAVLGHHHHHGLTPCHAHDHDHDHDHAHDHGPAQPSHSSYHHPTPTPPTVLSNPSGAEGEKGQVAGGPPGDAPEHGLPSDAAQIPVSKPLFSSPEAEAKMMGPGAATGGGGGGGDAGAGAVGAGKGSQGSDKTCAGHDGHGHQPSAPAHSYDHDHDHDHGHEHGRGEGIERRENLNLRSAMLHVIGDLVQSMGVALAGLLIWYKQDDPRWALADPICTFIFAILVLLTTRGIIIDIVHILMERTPTQHDLAEMYETMLEMNGVHDVHDLHVWNLSLGIPILSAHVNMDADGQPDSVLKKLQQFARSRGIRHSTIQICNPANPLPPSMRPGPRQV